MRDRLFSNDTLREFLNGQIRKIPQAVSYIPDDEVRSDPAAVIAEITQLLDVQPISIDWETKRADPLTETSILRRGSGQSFLPPNTTPVKVPANKVTWRVAYRGTTLVLTYRASRHRSGEYTALAFHPDIVYSVELPQASIGGELCRARPRPSDRAYSPTSPLTSRTHEVSPSARRHC